jgi:FAD-dependent urate hydroxylase
VLAAGFPTPTNLLLSSGGRRLGAVSNGGRLPDGTVSHTIKRARLYQGLLREASGRGVAVEYHKRLVQASSTPGGGVLAQFDDGSQAGGDVLIGADGVPSTTRRVIDPAAPGGRYVGLVNFGGYTTGAPEGAAPGVWHMIFGKRAFFGYVLDDARNRLVRQRPEGRGDPRRARGHPRRPVAATADRVVRRRPWAGPRFGRRGQAGTRR